MTDIAFDSQTAFEDYKAFKKALAIDPMVTGKQLEGVLMAYQMVTCMRLTALGADPSEFMQKTVDDIVSAA